MGVGFIRTLWAHRVLGKPDRLIDGDEAARGCPVNRLYGLVDSFSLEK
jgi:hypothetical protein